MDYIFPVGLFLSVVGSALGLMFLKGSQYSVTVSAFFAGLVSAVLVFFLEIGLIIFVTIFNDSREAKEALGPFLFLFAIPLSGSAFIATSVIFWLFMGPKKKSKP